ncbi:hypothetical protein V9L05_08720 [Bernardetia sp. Wsw4-3y2]|uniref:hypothetical protein n=1 Tax=Bernardetia sp. Wsw4-3y2 TaxID=3127471 RepID=UPI0030CFCBCC
MKNYLFSILFILVSFIAFSSFEYSSITEDNQQTTVCTTVEDKETPVSNLVFSNPYYNLYPNYDSRSYFDAKILHNNKTSLFSFSQKIANRKPTTIDFSTDAKNSIRSRTEKIQHT